MEKKASSSTHSVNYRSEARRGALTMNNEIRRLKGWIESDILMISFQGGKKSRLLPCTECFEDKCSDAIATQLPQCVQIGEFSELSSF